MSDLIGQPVMGSFTAVKLPGHNTREYLVQMWDYIEKEYKLHITVHDHIGCLQLSDGKQLRPGGNLHRSSYCAYCRKKFFKNCLQHCRWEAMQKASEADAPMISQCYARVVEVVVPLFKHGIHAATIFGGSFRSADFAIPEEWDLEQKKLYTDLPLWYRSNYPNIVRALELFGAAALAWAEKERNTPNSENSRRRLVEEFFQKKLTTRDCTLEKLAEKLNLSASRTSHILREEFQKSFSDMLTESRIQRICDLLETTDLPLRDIAQRTGLSNEYYLNRFFKRKKGIPPGQYRISTPKTADTTEDKNL